MKSSSKSSPTKSEFERLEAECKRWIGDQHLTLEELTDLHAHLLASYYFKNEEVMSVLRDSVDLLKASGNLLLEQKKNAEKLAPHISELQKMACFFDEAGEQRGIQIGEKLIHRRNAIKRHAEDYALKDDVFKWLDDNGATYEGRGKGKGIEAAARAISRQQPIAHTTARGWYKEWKELHPTSTL